MARDWLSIRVELVEGRDLTFWPRPGRDIAAAPTHTFAALAETIDTAFARWDRGHLHEFRLLDGTTLLHDAFDGPPEDTLPTSTPLNAVDLTRPFLYVFDLGDGWHHLCTPTGKVDPRQVLGATPKQPTVYDGWGELPDQYGRRWADDHDDSDVPPDPRRGDLPPFFDWWGEGAANYPA